MRVEKGPGGAVSGIRQLAGRKILVVTHEGMIKSLIYHESTLSDFVKEGQRLMPYHLHRLTFLSGRLAIEHLNFLDLSPAVSSSARP